jgi:hypothetical protein
MASATGLSDRGIRWGSSVSSPLRSLTRKLYPTTIDEVLRWAEELWLHHGTYSQAITKAVRYFMTELEIYGKDLGYGTRQKYKETLEAKYDLLTLLATIGDDFIAYGNSFTSLYIPFNRSLICPRCGFHAPLTKLEKDKDYSWSNFEFILTCPAPKCGYKGKAKHQDVKPPIEELNPSVVRWPPQLMRIEYQPITGLSKFYLKVSEFTSLVDGVTNGVPSYLNTTPWEIVQAVKEKGEVEFLADELYHMFTPMPAYTSAELSGWGLPKFMAEFEDVVMMSLLDKYNEVLLSDYLIPLRVVSPPSGGGPNASGGADPMLNIGMRDFVSKFTQIVDGHRTNPSDWNVCPFPVQYQILGGDAAKLTPIEILTHMEQRLLNSMGIPQEMYVGSIQNSAGPMIGFKMFERTWQHFASELNKWLNWFVAKNGELFQWEDVNARLIPVSIYEDPDVRVLKFELAASRQCSKTTAFRSIGLDANYERTRILEEEEEENKIMEEKAKKDEKKQIAKDAIRPMAPGEEMLMQEQQAQQQAGAPPAAPGQPPMPMPNQGGGTAGNASLDEMYAQAEQMATEIMQMPGGVRKSTLLDLNKNNKALHALVTQELKRIENQAGQQGKEMARQGQM